MFLLLSGIIALAECSTYSAAALFVVNKVRTNPKSVAPFVQKMIDSFKADGVTFTDMHGKEQKSKLGKGHFQKAYDFLMSQPQLYPLFEASCLTKAAEVLADDNARRKLSTGRTEADVPFYSLMDTYCNHTWEPSWAAYSESYGPDNTRNGALEDIIFLIIGDQFPFNNPNRQTIFNTEVQYMGAAKKVVYTQLFVAGNKVKVNLAALKSYRHYRLHHHRN
jgi:hypothetical protein